MGVGIRDPWRGLRSNLLLRSLTPRDALLLAPLVKRVTYAPGEVLTLDDENCSGSVYFPETLVVCLAGFGHSSGIGLIGREGVLGCDGVFGCSAPDHRAVVQLTGGSALVASAGKLRTLTAASPSLALSLVRFVQTFTLQMSRTIRSNLHDTMEARLSGWLLMLHDRIEGDELPITHRALASSLNVRRASVTDAMHLIEGEGALRCRRGRIFVRDRAKLEALAGVTYGTPERAYCTAIGPFGKSLPANPDAMGGDAPARASSSPFSPPGGFQRAATADAPRHPELARAGAE